MHIKVYSYIIQRAITEQVHHYAPFPPYICHRIVSAALFFLKSSI